MSCSLDRSTSRMKSLCLELTQTVRAHASDLKALTTHNKTHEFYLQKQAVGMEVLAEKGGKYRIYYESAEAALIFQNNQGEWSVKFARDVSYESAETIVACFRKCWLKSINSVQKDQSELVPVPVMKGPPRPPLLPNPAAKRHHHQRPPLSSWNPSHRG